MARELGEVIAVHGCAEAVPLAHKALVGDAAWHGDVIVQVPAGQLCCQERRRFAEVREGATVHGHAHDS